MNSTERRKTSLWFSPLSSGKAWKKVALIQVTEEKWGGEKPSHEGSQATFQSQNKEDIFKEVAMERVCEEGKILKDQSELRVKGQNAHWLCREDRILCSAVNSFTAVVLLLLHVGKKRSMTLREPQCSTSQISMMIYSQLCYITWHVRTRSSSTIHFLKASFHFREKIKHPFQ